MSAKGKRRHVDAVCLTCVHGGVCRRAGQGRCRDYKDRERYREIPPCGEIRFYWIDEFDDTFETNEDPHVEEEIADVEAWGCNDKGELYAIIEGEVMKVGRDMYLDAVSAEVALRTGAWREEE